MRWRLDLLARSTLLARLGDQISSLIDGDLAIVARTRCRRADFDGAAGEFVGNARIDA